MPNARGERGTICLTGTASDFTRGLFYDITNGREPGWSLHSWSALDNPYVAKQWQEELDDISQNRPLYKNTPQYKQWYLNQWVVDEEKLVYKYNAELNSIKQLPILNPNGWTYILGVDTGWEDDNAFVLCGYHINDCKLYVIKTFSKPKMTFDQVVDKIREFMSDSTYSPSKIIIDGANKQGVESMRQRSQIPFVYADKAGKVDHIEILNGDLIQGKIKILPCCQNLIEEMQCLVWRTEGGKLIFPKKEHPSLPNHLCDSFLYSFFYCYQYHSAPEEKKIPVYSKEWYQKQSENIWEREREKFEQEQEDACVWSSFS